MSSRVADSGGIVIFSGGSAANSLVDVFESIRRAQSSTQPHEARPVDPSSLSVLGTKEVPLRERSKQTPTSSISYIIPISDNGGSSSELIRVFGGPGIGDVRSRLVRLIPRVPYNREREAIAALLSGRLSSSDAKLARDGWNDIVDGTSALWRGISSGKKELIRSFFNLVNLEILKRSRPPNSTFDFTSASVGNLFLTGARLFSGSFESAIYLLSVVCGIAEDEVKVIPSINSNFSHHIAAGLEDGTLIVGQNAISHPIAADGVSVNETKMGTFRNRLSSRDRPGVLRAGSDAVEAEISDGIRSNSIGHWEEDEDHSLQQEEEDAHPPFTLPTLRTKNINFTKLSHELSELPSRIDRLYYINSYGQEILPPANPRAIAAINNAKAIIYSIGSLYTSIVPSLILRGIGDAMRKSKARTKILILNGCLDREVGPLENHQSFTAIDFVDAIVKAGEQSRGIIWNPGQPGRERFSNGQAANSLESSNAHSTLIVNAEDTAHGFRGPPLVRRNTLFAPPMLASTMPSRAGSPSPPGSPTRRPSAAAATALDLASTSASSRSSSKPDPIYKHYVSHLVHLPNAVGTPFVDDDALTANGIRSVSVPGIQNPAGDGMLYDLNALRVAVEEILIQKRS